MGELVVLVEEVAAGSRGGGSAGEGGQSNVLSYVSLQETLYRSFAPMGLLLSQLFGSGNDISRDLQQNERGNLYSCNTNDVNGPVHQHRTNYCWQRHYEALYLKQRRWLRNALHDISYI